MQLLQRPSSGDQTFAHPNYCWAQSKHCRIDGTFISDSTLAVQAKNPKRNQEFPLTSLCKERANHIRGAGGSIAGSDQACRSTHNPDCHSGLLLSWIRRVNHTLSRIEEFFFTNTTRCDAGCWLARGLRLRVSGAQIFPRGIHRRANRSKAARSSALLVRIGDRQGSV